MTGHDEFCATLAKARFGCEPATVSVDGDVMVAHVRLPISAVNDILAEMESQKRLGTPYPGLWVIGFLLVESCAYGALLSGEEKQN
jgi:hypothetical protein